MGPEQVPGTKFQPRVAPVQLQAQIYILQGLQEQAWTSSGEPRRPIEKWVGYALNLQDVTKNPGNSRLVKHVCAYVSEYL